MENTPLAWLRPVTAIASPRGSGLDAGSTNRRGLMGDTRAVTAASPASTRKNAGGVVPFVMGGTAGVMATSIVQPIELIKTRMQLAGEGGGKRPPAVRFIRDMIRAEGFTGLYNGFSAAIMRQMTYTTGRMGMFQTIKGWLQEEGETSLPLWKRAVAGLGAGAVGAVVGNPAEISMIRMMADGRLPAAERRNYKHAGDAVFRIVREEGVVTLWRGSGPTIARAMLLNCAQLASYDQVKHMLLGSGYFSDNIYCHFAASLCSGLLATIVSMPADMAKTRLQNMKVAEGAAPKYTGTVDVLTKVIRQEGFFSLWKGFVPYFLRLGQHTIYVFIFFEQMNQAYNRFLDKKGAAE